MRSWLEYQKWMREGGYIRYGLILSVLIIVLCTGLVLSEASSSRLQASYLTKLAHKLTFRVSPGVSDAIRFPASGPFDRRLGYSRIPEFAARLHAKGFSITAQSRMSSTMIDLSDQGIFSPYHEKNVAGLTLYDRNARLMYTARFPERVYDKFASVPPLIVRTLLYIENRDLLNLDPPTRNPAISWPRLVRVMSDQIIHLAVRSHETPGASTLATQIEKFRHSPGGETVSRTEKLRQMASASIRAYLGGRNTLTTRQHIVVDYLNTVPLSAKQGFGEIEGLGDGLWIWYGQNFAEVNDLLRQPFAPIPSQRLERQIRAYKEVLSLMLAQRAPSYYLRGNPAHLEQLTASYLQNLAGAGVISQSVCEAALAIHLTPHETEAKHSTGTFVAQKAANAARIQLANLLGEPDLYVLDHLDLSATTTINDAMQSVVSAKLHSVSSVSGAKDAGMYGFNLLRTGEDPSRLLFSFLLYERGDFSNRLLVQTDSREAPFDINQGARLNLGSTAKLRTVINYLQIVSDLYQHYAARPIEELKQIKFSSEDKIRIWVRNYLVNTQNPTLPDILIAALERTYSASPAEAFYTGGSLQTFNNFESEDNGKILTIREAFQHSVNLVFVRLMRDIVHYYMLQNGASINDILGDPAARQAYLSRFADREGSAFLADFFRQFSGKTPQETETLLLQGFSEQPVKLAVLFRSIHPQASFEQFNSWMIQREGKNKLPTEKNRALYDKYGADKYSLADRAYIARLHPLEIWLVEYLSRKPHATLTQALADSRNIRQDAYIWLFKTNHEDRQNKRIRYMIEFEAYEQICREWRALGYPFGSITASYASAIGAAGDRPAALAELVGIILNGGVRKPVQTISQLQFAVGTPYETRFVQNASRTAQVLPVAVANAVHKLLLDVVNGGTGIRVKDAYITPDHLKVEVGGKTGTGDQRFEVYAHGNRLIESRKVNRSATFVFFLGDRYFGVATAYVHEPYAASYSFTSALTVQLLKSLAPDLLPMIEAGQATAIP